MAIQRSPVLPENNNVEQQQDAIEQEITQDPCPHIDTFVTSQDFILFTSTINSSNMNTDCAMFDALYNHETKQTTVQEGKDSV